jgi:hypothetical protein
VAEEGTGGCDEDNYDELLEAQMDAGDDGEGDIGYSDAVAAGRAKPAGAPVGDGGERAAPDGAGVRPEGSAPAPTRHGSPISLPATVPHVPGAPPYISTASPVA